MKIVKCFSALLIIISPVIMALPKITLVYGESSEGFTRVKVKNETLLPLACFVAIDGHKKKFQLRAKSTSIWITSSDSRYNYQNFSTWCDYLDLNPDYKVYALY